VSFGSSVSAPDEASDCPAQCRRYNLTFLSIGTLKRSGLVLNDAAFTKDDVSSDLDHSSSLTLLMNLSIPEIRRRNALRLARPSWPSRRLGLFPLTKEF